MKLEDKGFIAPQVHVQYYRFIIYNQYNDAMYVKMLKVLIEKIKFANKIILFVLM